MVREKSEIRKERWRRGERKRKKERGLDGFLGIIERGESKFARERMHNLFA